MNTYTGETVPLGLLTERIAAGENPAGWVEVIGDPDDVARLSRAVRATAAQDRKRKARRRQQRASRRANRP